MGVLHVKQGLLGMIATPQPTSALGVAMQASQLQNHLHAIGAGANIPTEKESE